MILSKFPCPVISSRPARGVWVEIFYLFSKCVCYFVTSRKGRVSRNTGFVDNMIWLLVTSRKGRVSRNVDEIEKIFETVASRPARGVWVEMCVTAIITMFLKVTSRKGRVSRNAKYDLQPDWFKQSRPARGVWVEIFFDAIIIAQKVVTSRKGRVSRNLDLFESYISSSRHVPQGACE